MLTSLCNPKLHFHTQFFANKFECSVTFFSRSGIIFLEANSHHFYTDPKPCALYVFAEKAKDRIPTLPKILTC